MPDSVYGEVNRHWQLSPPDRAPNPSPKVIRTHRKDTELSMPCSGALWEARLNFNTVRSCRYRHWQPAKNFIIQCYSLWAQLFSREYEIYFTRCRCSRDCSNQASNLISISSKSHLGDDKPTGEVLAFPDHSIIPSFSYHNNLTKTYLNNVAAALAVGPTER